VSWKASQESELEGEQESELGRLRGSTSLFSSGMGMRHILEEYDVIMDKLKQVVPRDRRVFGHVLREYADILSSILQTEGLTKDEQVLANRVLRKLTRLSGSTLSPSPSLYS
jgi:hypothetical protein